MGSIVQPCTVAFWWSMQAWRMEELIPVTSPHACLTYVHYKTFWTIYVSPFSATKLQEEDTICCLIRSMPPHCLACIHACRYHTNYKSGAEGSTMLFLIGKSKAN